jgi:hypothetical protein
MTYPQGINFRDTLAYVTDGANESFATYNGFNPTYPTTTAQGNTVGWEGAVGNGRDRTTSNDRRLAGIQFTSSSQVDFRFDLPAAGSYNIRIAAGDAGGVNNTNWSLVDGTTALVTLTSGTNSVANSFRDATNTVLTAAAWPSSNTAVTQTFATTICRFRSTSSGNDAIAHFYIESASGTQTFIYTAVGGFVLGGAALVTRSAVKTPTGGITMSGTAVQSRSSVKTTSGGIAFAGTAPQVRGKAVTASGGIALGGTASVLRGLVKTASGGILFAGAASVSFHSAVQTLIVTPVGGMVFAGTAAIVRTTSRVAAGGIALGGAASTVFFHFGQTIGNWIGVARHRRRD